MSSAANHLAVESVDQLGRILRAFTHIRPRGGGSKPALSAAADAATPLDLRGLTGILEYEPGEYTVTARAGTPLAEVQAALAENGQYLPFDPPLVNQGATLGGTVAAGVSGSGRYRYGGVRDFLIGIRFVDGQGRLVRGGGKVVKNAAGFDLPKLMVGSLGRLGILVELTFKVFPKPQSYASLRVNYPNLAEALAGMRQAAAAHLDLDCLDTVVDGAEVALWARMGGWEAVLSERIGALRALLGAGDEVSGADEQRFWAAAREFSWAPPAMKLVKVATTGEQLLALDEALAAGATQRRYTVGGNLTWLAWSGPVSDLHAQLAGQGLAGLVLRGTKANPWIGRPFHNSLSQRIKQTLDPDGKFLTVNGE